MAGDMGEDISARPHSEGFWNTEAAQTTTSGMICSMAWHGRHAESALQKNYGPYEAWAWRGGRHALLVSLHHQAMGHWGGLGGY